MGKDIPLFDNMPGYLQENVNSLGAVQKLRNSPRGEGVDDFFTYRYVYLRGRGVFYEIVT